MRTRIAAAQPNNLPGDEREAALPHARRGLRARGPGPRRARLGLRRSRDRRGDGARRHGLAAGPLPVLPAAQPREPPSLPPLRPADRPRRLRLPVLRATPRSAVERPLGLLNEGCRVEQAGFGVVAAVGLGLAHALLWVASLDVFPGDAVIG